MALVTDMNERERTKFISRFEEIEKAAHDAIEALKLRNDTDLTVAVIKFSLLGPSVSQELAEILQSAQSVTIPDKPQ